MFKKFNIGFYSKKYSKYDSAARAFDSTASVNILLLSDSAASVMILLLVINFLLLSG